MSKLYDTGRRAANTVYLNYEADSNFDSGTLYAKRLRDSHTVSQAVTGGGTQTFAGLTSGEVYVFYVEALDSGDSFIGLSDVVVVDFSGPDDYGNKWLDIRYRSDSRDWRSTRIGTDTDRRRVVTNMAGHWFQCEIQCNAPNQRLVLESHHLEERIRGRRMHTEQ